MSPTSCRAFASYCRQEDGLRVGRPGAEIAKLVAHGFLEIERANGHAATAKLTLDGYRALVLRLAKRLP